MLPHLPLWLFLKGEIERLSTELNAVLDAAPFAREPWRMPQPDASTRSEDLLLAIVPNSEPSASVERSGVRGLS
jgi:hypothetical protein